MVKLNKNQRKFFEEGIKFFGERAYNLKYKELKLFAEENELILPISALKEYCKMDIRGQYNIVLDGFDFQEEVKEKEVEVKVEEVEKEEFTEKENIIIDTPAFVDPPQSRKQMKKLFSTEGKTPIRIQDPIFIVLNYENDPIFVHKTAAGAFKSGIQALLHDGGNRVQDDVVLELMYEGTAIVDSINSGLWFKIVMFPVKK